MHVLEEVELSEESHEAFDRFENFEPLENVNVSQSPQFTVNVSAGSSHAGASRQSPAITIEHTTGQEAKFAVLRAMGNAPHFLGMSIYLLQVMPTLSRPVEYEKCIAEGLVIAAKLFDVGGPAIRLNREDGLERIRFTKYFRDVCMDNIQLDFKEESVYLADCRQPQQPVSNERNIDLGSCLAILDICGDGI